VSGCGRNDLVVLGWIHHHTRNEGLATELGGVTRYITWGPRGNPLVAVLRYVVQFVMTLWVLGRDRPKRVMCMLPPFPALVACLLYSWVRRAVLVGDVHTYPLVSRTWRPFLPFTAWLLRRAGGAVVTNEANAEILRARRVNTLVLDDTPSLTEGRDTPPDPTRRLVVFPASFDPDEPMEELLSAAAANPDIELVITGRDPTGRVDPAEVPGNVRLVGFVSRDEYERYLTEATVVCALTTLEDCMQQAGYEAMAWGRPLVTSDTAVLRTYFGDAACFATPDAASIGNAWRDAMDHRDEIHRAMVALGEARAAARPAEIVALRELMQIG
jgi:glycosyltransferase involved in cell wall biosynthesis